MINYYGGYGNSSYFDNTAIQTALLIVAVLLALGACVAAYIFFFSKGEKRYTGFVAFMHEFFNFKKLVVLDILKITYVFVFAFLTVYGVFLMFSSFLLGLLLIVLGNIAARIGYEMTVLLFSIHQNLTEINRKTKPEAETAKKIDGQN